MKGKVIVEGDATLIDEFAREMIIDLFNKLTTRIDTINERTKLHTLDIREIRNKIKGGAE